MPMTKPHTVTIEDVTAALDTEILLCSSHGRGESKRMTYNPQQEAYTVRIHDERATTKSIKDAVRMYNEGVIFREDA